MANLVSVMQAHFRTLVLDFELRYSAEQISHAGERGRLLEVVLASFLADVLPARVGVGSGQIIGAVEKKPSSQCDIVLYDALNFPLLLNQKSFQLFIAESVLAVIEVKSTLNKAEVTKGLTAIASAKKPHKFPRSAHPSTLGILFGYKTSWKRPQSLRRLLYQQLESSPATAPDLICSLEPSFLIASTNSLGFSLTNMSVLLAGTEKESSYPPDKYILLQPADKEHLLVWFYLVLLNYLNMSLKIGISLGQYIKSGTSWSTSIL